MGRDALNENASSQAYLKAESAYKLSLCDTLCKGNQPSHDWTRPQVKPYY